MYLSAAVRLCLLKTSSIANLTKILFSSIGLDYCCFNIVELEELFWAYTRYNTGLTDIMIVVTVTIIVDMVRSTNIIWLELFNANPSRCTDL